MRKKITVFFTLLSLLLVLASCAGKGDGPGKDGQSTVAKAFDNGILIQTEDNGPRWLITQYDDNNGSPKVEATWFRIAKDTVLEDEKGNKLSPSDFQPGQQVEAWYIGGVNESYPLQATAAKIVLLSGDQLPAGIVTQEAAIQAALKAAQPQMFWTVKQAELQADQSVWTIEMTDGNHLESTTTLLIDAKTGDVRLQPVAENDAFRLFSPAPDTEVGASFKVSGEARVFEAAFSWSLEDGHNILAKGHVMADKGAPEWGTFEFDVSYSNATNPTLLLIIYVASAKDGSMEHELIIPLKQLKR